MILSHKHQFIFIHGQKTAGSTINSAINPYLGPFDVQVGAWDDTLNNGGKLNFRAWCVLLPSFPRVAVSTIKNSLRDKKIQYKFTKKRFNSIINNFYRKKHNFTPRAAHATAYQVSNTYPVAWDRYFKFTIVRNPWDHAVSYYYWNTRNVAAKYGSNISFNEFLRRYYDQDRSDPEGVRPKYRTNWEIYAIDDQVAVDYVVRFENLSEDLDYVAQRIGIPINTEIKAKSSFRDKKKDLEDHYDAECMRLVEKIYEKEIEHFGYKPPF